MAPVVENLRVEFAAAEMAEFMGAELQEVPLFESCALRLHSECPTAVLGTGGPDLHKVIFVCGDACHRPEPKIEVV